MPRKIKELNKWRIGTWNVQSLYQKGKLANVIKEMKRLHIKVLGLSEVRWTGIGQLPLEDGTIIFSGGNKHEKGVAIILQEPFNKKLIGFHAVSERVILVKIEEIPFSISIIQVYAPTADCDEDEIEKFYEDLDKGKALCNSQDIVFVMGDLNAKTGKGKVEDVVGDFGLGIRNNRGDKWVEWCKLNDQIILNTWYEHHPRRLWTWKSPNGNTKNQIDYITINRRFRNCISNTKTFPGADCGSDHNPIISEVRIKLKKENKQNVKSPQFDINEIRKNEEMKLRLKNCVLTTYDKMSPEESIEKDWNNLKKSIENGIKQEVPIRKNTKINNPWMTEDILDLMEERRRHKGTEKYASINKIIKKKCLKAKEVWYNERCAEIELLSVNNREKMYSKVKQMQGNKKYNSDGCIKDKQGNILMERSKKLERWAEYIEELYNDPNRGDIPYQNINNDGPAILEEEIELAIKSIGNNKAVGPDEISADIIKGLEEIGVQLVTKLANRIYNTGYIPEDLRRSWITVIPKKSRASLCEQHRTICVMSHVMKIILKVILQRLRGKIKREISPEQYGFVQGKGTRNAVITLRSIIDRHLEVNKEVHMVFIDFKKAFDMVNHEKLINILKKHMVDDKDLRLISNLYWLQNAAVKLEGSVSRYINIKQGVRQGCVLSPDLFNLFSEEIFKDIELMGVKMGGSIINNIRYADDTVLFSETAEQIQRLTETVNKRCQEWGLTINPDKTTYMVATRKKADIREEIKLENETIRQVFRCKYLGSIITSRGDSVTDIKARIAQAKTSFTKIKNLLTNRNIKCHTKIRMIKTYIWSVLTYGCESWSLNKNEINLLKATEMWFFRKMLKIQWTSKTSNDKVLKRLKTKRELISKIRKQQMEFLGHIIRAKGLEWDAISGKVNGKRPRGRNKISFVQSIVRDAECNSFEELSRLASDRTKWRTLIANVCIKHGT